MNRPTRDSQAGTNPDPSFHRYPFWAPRFWHGMRLGDWLALLASHGFRAHYSRWPMVGAVTFFSCMNSCMAWFQKLLCGQRLQNVRIHEAPVFIVGHWRSGTTYLHELLALDSRFGWPNTYQCFAPHHFLITEWFLARLLWYVIPSRRPMDNVKVSWKQPQEDEFALCTMGVPTPYRNLAYPSSREDYLPNLAIENLTKRQQEQWKEGLVYFMRCLTYRESRPILLKSPTHTARIGMLASLFPKARFIHIVRDPMVIVPSTIRMWTALESTQSIEWPRTDGLRDYVFKAYRLMYDGFESGAGELPPDRLVTVRYEDLVHEPIDELRRIYQQLQLDRFDAILPKLSEYARHSKSYITNRYDLDDNLRKRIADVWSDYISRYGYSDDEAGKQSDSSVPKRTAGSRAVDLERNSPDH